MTRRARYSVWEVGLAVLLALGACPRRGATQVHVQQIPPSAVGHDIIFWYPRGTASAFLLPSGDVIQVGNFPPDSTRRGSETCIGMTRLRVLAPGDTTVTIEYQSRSAGEGVLTPGFSVKLRDGYTFTITEIYRRHAACGSGAGMLVIFFKLEAPAPPVRGGG